MRLLLKLSFFCLLTIHGFYAYGQQPTDCINAVIACGNSDITLDVSGVGTQELSGSNTCSSQENNSIWLQVTLVSDGTLGFTLTPNSADINEDYDFFVFGPNVSCGNIGQAIRCSTTNPDNAGQTNNLTGMNATSTETSEGPGPDGDSFVRWLDVLAGETYYIVIDRPIGNSPFNLEWTGTATFSDPPTDQSAFTGTILDLESCDVDMPFTDAFTTFNLSNNTASIRGSQTDVEITYHESASDANIGINPLPNRYTNISNPQTIHTRITNNTTGCFELSSFNLNVSLGPDFNPPTDFILCDNLNDGDNKNGRVTFNLTSKNEEILNGQDPADFNISYHTTLTNAETKTGPFLNSYYNTSPFNDQVFVRIEEVLNPDCSSVTTLNLVVRQTPEAFNHTILQCDEDGLLDGITMFNLNQANTELTGNIEGRSTKFYEDKLRTKEVNGDAFTTTSDRQIIYVEIINDDTGCSNFSELNLNVSLTDVQDAVLETCDDDGIEDGFHVFDLSEANNIIIDGIPDELIISYYETYENALLEQNVLESSFTNTIPDSQIIYARVENMNNCYGISEVNLVVNPLPDIDVDDLDYYCLNIFPNTIPIDAALINDLPSNYTYAWSTGENTYEIQINQPNTYTVTVTNINTLCTKDRTIVVEPSNIASFDPIEPFQVTDASENNTIIVFASGEGTYQYALYDEDNTIVYKPFQDSNVFDNISPGIYNVRVKDIKNDCGTINDKVSVIGFPKFFTPNNDGVNDTWQVLGVSSMFQPNTRILIFNRFGKLIKQLDPLSKGWNGLLNGVKLPSDDYWFSITLQDGRIFSNHFTLKY